MEFSKSYRRYP